MQTKIIALALLTTTAAPAAASVEYTVTNLGNLGRTNYNIAYAINNAGVITGVSSTADDRHAFVWNSGVISDVGIGGRTSSVGSSINNSNTVVGTGKDFNGHDHAFIQSGCCLTELGGFGEFSTFANSINDYGQIAGSAATSENIGHEHAVFSSGGVIRDLGTFGGGSSAAYGINNSAQIVGAAATAANNFLAFVSEAGGPLRSLGTLGGDESAAFAINNGGFVTGYSADADGYLHAFLWNPNNSLTDLGTAGGALFSFGQGINTAGDVVGFSLVDDSNSVGGLMRRATIFRNGTARDLNDLIAPQSNGLILSAAYGINDSGQIVGYAQVGYDLQAVLLTPYTPPVGGVPEPTTWALMLGGFVLTGGMLRRRTRLATVAA